MDKDLENGLDNEEIPAQTDPAAENGTSRRRFTRNAVVGSAVLVSLGNRAAWGQDPGETCMSATILASFVANGNKFASMHPGHETGIAEEIVNASETHEHGTQICVGPDH